MTVCHRHDKQTFVCALPDAALRGSASLNHSGVEALFAGAPRPLAEIFAAAAASTPQAFELPTRVSLVTRSTHQDVDSANLVARLEGSDPALKDEHVVYIAHVDHFGRGVAMNGDDIYNGAHDNASGVAIVLEVARAYSALPTRPRRSTLFLFVTAEERGLLGSDYFARHPEFVQHAIGLVRLVNVNEATLRMFGALDKRQLLESLHAIFLPETSAIFAEELLTIVAGRRTMEAETVLRTLDGRHIDVLFTMSFPAAHERFDRVLVSLMDITERKRAELALRDADRNKNEFLATLGHELRAQGQSREAASALDEALATARAALGDAHPLVAIYLLERADLHAVSGRSDLARPLVHDALRIRTISPDVVPMRRRAFAGSAWTLEDGKRLLARLDG